MSVSPSTIEEWKAKFPKSTDRPIGEDKQMTVDVAFCGNVLHFKKSLEFTTDDLELQNHVLTTWVIPDWVDKLYTYKFAWVITPKRDTRKDLWLTGRPTKRGFSTYEFKNPPEIWDKDIHTPLFIDNGGDKLFMVDAIKLYKDKLYVRGKRIWKDNIFDNIIHIR